MEYMDQFQMFLNNGGVIDNSRNRKRETLPQQSNYTGLRLAYGRDQQQQQQQMQLYQQQNFILPFPTSCFPEHLSTHIRQQREEIDQVLRTHEDQLRRTIAERQQKHYRALMDAMEETTNHRLKEKETELENATRRNSELEERVSQLRVQTQVWKARARTQEVTAASLQTQLQQVMMGVQDRSEEEESGSQGGSHSEDAESTHIDPERVKSGTLVSPCKVCGRRVASVVMLPCRHLCLCSVCAASTEVCPVCQSHMSSSVEVYF